MIRNTNGVVVMRFKIVEVFKGHTLTITPAAGDTSTTIAHLAQFTKFEMPAPIDTAPACAAIATVADEFWWETVEYELDYHGASWAQFRDGSMISIQNAS